MGELRQKQPIVKRRRKLTRAQRTYERECQEAFYRDTLRLDGGKCIGATIPFTDHRCTGSLRAHHAVKQQWLRTYVRTLEPDVNGGWTEDRISEFLWDPANGVTVCDGLHDAHHDGTDFKVPAWWLPGRVIDFAEAYRIKHILHREHPSHTDGGFSG